MNPINPMSVKSYKSDGPVHLALDKNNLDVITTFARVGGVECLRVKNQKGFSVLERLAGNENFGDIFKCGLYRYIQKVKWGAPSRWSFRPISARGRIETTI